MEPLAALGAVSRWIGRVLALRRQREELLDRRDALVAVLDEAVANLAAVRDALEGGYSLTRRWAPMHAAFRFRAWYDHRSMFKGRLRDPTLPPDLVAEIDALYDELEHSSNGTFDSRWESRLFGVSSHLNDAVAAYPARRLDRLRLAGAPRIERPRVDAKLLTPRDAGEFQRRALAAFGTERRTPDA
jgi:hypothetical protein